MPRARNIKPSFFKNEALAELPPECRLLFIGLWCLADREGYLEYRPKKIKAELFPYDDYDCPRLALGLHEAGLIQILEIGSDSSERVIFIPNFTKHQHPHHREAESEILNKIKGLSISPRPALGQPQEGLGKARLNPDILNPDILNPESNKVSLGKALGSNTKKIKGDKNDNPAKPINQVFCDRNTVPAEIGAIASEFKLSEPAIWDEWTRFYNYWAYECPTSKRKKVDWPATWRNWLKRINRYNTSKSSYRPSVTDVVRELNAAIDSRAGQDD